MSCASCGRPIGADARFCPNCGAPQAPATEERRIVTVLFADIVGFTSLAEGMDPEDVKHVVDRAFEHLVRDIRAFGGAVDKIMGDGIIALFGAPVAHEDDAERAVRAALRMQQSLEALSDADPPIRLRIGVNTGEVLVGSSSAGGDYTAMGDVMNSAQRLQELAEPGQTLVGSATRDATGDAIAYRPAGQLPARGRERPIDAFVALEAVRPPGFHRQRDARFVGRAQELALLEAQARLAVTGSRAQLALIVGDAGMGKTRLASEAAHVIQVESGAVVVEGRCLPYGEANVWWPIADLIRQLFDLGADATAEVATRQLRSGLDARLSTSPARDPHADLDRLTTALAHALGYDTPLRGGDRNRNRSEVKLAFTTVLETELAARPVVLVLSDMHWAAAAVWELVDHLLTELARSRLMVMATARGDSDDTRLPRGRHGMTVIQLGPLDDAAAGDLLGELGIDLAPTLVHDLVDRSGGNPLFLEELAGLVAKRGAAASAEFRIDADELPATLRGIIAARLDELDEGELDLLEDASVLGRTGPVEGLLTLAHETRGASGVHTDLARLVDKDLLELDGHRYRFRSDLVRDVVYGRLTKTVRAQQHFGIAQYLEKSQAGTVRNSVAVAIAEHYRAAAQLCNEVTLVADIDRADVVERALYWLNQAGERALVAGEPKQAARWYDSGVALAQSDAWLSRFVYGRAKARTEIHDIAGARADLDRLESLSDLDPDLAAKALLVRGDVDRKAGDLDLAASRLREAADRLAALDLTDQQALALRLLGMTEMVRSHDALARQALETSRAVAMASGDRRAEAWALQTLAWHAFRLGLVLDARAMVEQAIGIFTELDDQGGVMWSRGVLAWVAFHTGAWDEARALVDAVLPETRRRGDPSTEGIMLNLDASLRLWSGRAQQAHSLAIEAREVAEQLDDVTIGVQARALQGRALVSLGRIEEGSEVLLEAYSMADVADDSESRRIAVIANCASASRLGEPERVIRWAARFDSVLEDPGAVGEIDLIVALALALLQRGAVDEAASQLGWIEEEASGAAGHAANAAGAVVAAASGRDQEAAVLVERTLSGTGSTYLDRMLALLARAGIHTRSGDLAGRDAALIRARAEVASTDDQPSRLLIDLVSAIFGAGSLADAEDRMRAGGLDPAGWTTAWSLIVRPANPARPANPTPT